MTAATGERNKTIEYDQSTWGRGATTNEASRNASTRYKTGTTARSKVLNSRNETGASTEQGEETINRNASPPISPQVSTFPSPDMKSKKQMLRDYHLNAGRLTITADKKPRPLGADGRIDLMVGTSEFKGPAVGQSVNRVKIVNPMMSKDCDTTFDRSASPMNAMNATMSNEVQKRIQTSVPTKKRGSLNSVDESRVSGVSRPHVINCTFPQAKTPLKHHQPLHPLSPGYPKTATNDTLSQKPSTMYGQPISHQGVTHPTSPGQPRKKPAFVIQSKKDYSGQLLALGKGADTVLIKDMIRTHEQSATGSNKPTHTAESAPATPASSSKR